MQPRKLTARSLPLLHPGADEASLRGDCVCVLRVLIRVLVVIILIQLVNVTGARAQSLADLPISSSVPLASTQAHPTLAWVLFCKQSPSECSVEISEPEVITLDRNTWMLASAINAWVNATVRPVTDLDHWGVEDRWDYPSDGSGDCEDIQLLKRRLLVAAGLSRRALRMTVVLDEGGAGHAVLMMRTDRGDFILDNKSDLVRAWHDTGYEFIKREGTEGRAWVALSQHATALATAKP